FVTCAEEKGKRRGTLCFGRDDGKLLWERWVPFAGKEPTHQTNPYCSATPVTDGERLIVSHGSAGIFCYDLSGKLLWETPVGTYTHIWGNASSPVLDGDHVYQHMGPGLLVKMFCLDKRSGKIVWEKRLKGAEAKEEGQFFGSWATPVLLERGGKRDLVLPLPGRLVGFEARTGEEAWWCEGLTDLCYVDAHVGKEAIVAMSGFRGAALGMRRPGPGDSGDLTATHRVWQVKRNQQRIGSGVIAGGRLYMPNEPGVVEAIDIKTGEEVWKGKPGGAIWSSAILAHGRIHIVDRTGVTHVLAPGDEFKKLGEGRVTGEVERTHATPAIIDGEIYVRTWEALYRVGKGK
ncbi:MAG: PQQ-binding-like beta-propeller repeat protein, partial [Akkermansiaceae bacterium]|nr:PQQ-binding-like beta-propeller repeat protein [Akkermansiaceae bacterium]